MQRLVELAGLAVETVLQRGLSGRRLGFDSAAALAARARAAPRLRRLTARLAGSLHGPRHGQYLPGSYPPGQTAAMAPRAPAPPPSCEFIEAFSRPLCLGSHRLGACRLGAQRLRSDPRSHRLGLRRTVAVR